MIVLIGVLLSILGAMFVANGKPLYANISWVIGQPLLAYHNYSIGEHTQSALFLIYVIIAIYGIYNLRT